MKIRMILTSDSIFKDPTNSNLFILRLVSEGHLYTIDISLGVWEASVLNVPLSSQKFIMPLMYHSFGKLMDQMSYQVGEICIDAANPTAHGVYKATVTLTYLFKHVVVEKFIMRASDAIILSVILNKPLWVEHILCNRVEQSSQAIQEFVATLKPEDFDPDKKESD